MIELLVLTLFKALMTFCTLLITGRIFTYLSSEIKVTWLEDIQASALICAIVMTAQLVAGFVPVIGPFVPLLYIGLIYFAFQLDGIMDIIMFYFLHIAVYIAFSFLGLSLLFSLNSIA